MDHRGLNTSAARRQTLLICINGPNKRLRECIERKPHRDFRKLVYWAKPNDAAARAIGLDVRIAVSGELFERGVKGVQRSPLKVTSHKRWRFRSTADQLHRSLPASMVGDH